MASDSSTFTDFSASLREFDGNHFSGDAFESMCNNLAISMIEDCVFMDGRLTKRTVSYISGNSGSDYIEETTESEDGVKIVVRFYKMDYAPSNDKGRENLTSLFCKSVSDCIALYRVKSIYGKMRYYDINLGMPNVNYFHNRVAKLLETDDYSNYTSAFINLKSFNQLNRFFGSSITGKAIAMIAKTLDAFVDKDKGEFIVYVGGDNFAAVVLNSSVEAFKKLLSSMPITLESEGNSFTHVISARAGLAGIDKSISYANDALSPCSVALQIARNTGVDIVSYSDLNVELSSIQEFSRTLSKAVEENKFLIYFQPVVEVENSPSLYQAEALARWNRDGRISIPDEFIENAKNSGLDTKIDFYVLNKACEAIASWREQKLDIVPITCNFSGRNFFNNEFVDHVIRTIDKYKVPHELIGIEFSEPDFNDGKQLLIDIANKLSRQGVKITIDKFGTGMSSFTFLQELKADFIKIDFGTLSFEDPRGSIIAKNLIKLSEALGFTVICKGVRTEQDAEDLMLCGCTHFQSFLYDKPLTERFYERRLKKPDYAEQK